MQSCDGRPGLKSTAREKRYKLVQLRSPHLVGKGKSSETGILKRFSVLCIYVIKTKYFRLPKAVIRPLFDHYPNDIFS